MPHRQGQVELAAGSRPSTSEEHPGPPARADGVFRHEALLYSGPGEFVDAVRPFVADALAEGQPFIVAVPAWNAEPLRVALGDDAARVDFFDMLELGRNPGRIIAAWRDFLDRTAVPGRGVRGVAETIWAGRTQEEVDECGRHEALLHSAFRDDDFWLLCPYDTSALPGTVIDGARRRHPVIRTGGTLVSSDAYHDEELVDAFGGGLTQPPPGSRRLNFGIEDLGTLRSVVAAKARSAGVADHRVSELVVAVNEVATNSVLHGGGHGTMVVWSNGGTVHCEISDPGIMTDPLVGRGRAASQDESGRGLWLAHQLCDLVQVRSTSSGTVVRMHVQTP
jgi:anti-sigma regulatory factor (Ser/Thr protein kinase)